MSEEPSPALEAALTELDAAAKRKHRPTRQHARALLIALGERLPDEPELLPVVSQRLERTLGPLREAWEAALLDELLLACTEHVRSCDPRYFGHPRYDWEYTLVARAQLEARLRAAHALGVPLDAALLRKVERADALLQQRLPVAWRPRARELGLRSDAPEVNPGSL